MAFRVEVLSPGFHQGPLGFEPQVQDPQDRLKLAPGGATAAGLETLDHVADRECQIAWPDSFLEFVSAVSMPWSMRRSSSLALLRVKKARRLRIVCGR